MFIPSCKFESIHFCTAREGIFIKNRKSKEISKFMTLNGRNKFFLVIPSYSREKMWQKPCYYLRSLSKIYVRQARTECNSNVDQYFSSNVLAYRENL